MRVRSVLADNARSRKVDRVIEGDRRFFRRYPDRSFRVRIASQDEIAEFRAGDLADGLRWFVVIRQVIREHVRLRLLFPCYRDAETDVSEARCAAIYAAVAPGAQS
ncbi:hypothetical protein MBUL_02960 [Methylobacterium bullatum]|uniref:Uncharacterized protein n=1 Tax=Methylobacterium bullatum TaxID=570505 RepID=A0A679JF42_9HYPH|nr:hypothetical protein MBUL_02960 [Methylobacterium bullatum]